MPSIANITIKKNDGTTDIVYSAQSPSSGDGVPAVWKSATVGMAPSHQPEFRLSAREGSKGAQRFLRGTFQYPQIATNTTTGVTSVIDRATFACEWHIPKNMAQTDINEFASQIANLLTATLIKDCVKNGYSAS